MKCMFGCVVIAVLASCSEKEGTEDTASGCLGWVSLGCPAIDPEGKTQAFTWEDLAHAGDEPYMIKVYDANSGYMAPSSFVSEHWNADGVTIIWTNIPENCEVFALSLAGA